MGGGAHSVTRGQQAGPRDVTSARVRLECMCRKGQPEWGCRMWLRELQRAGFWVTGRAGTSGPPGFWLGASVVSVLPADKT